MKKMEQYTRLDLPLLLPDVDSERDACIDRLVGLLEQRDGVSRVHVVRPGEPDAAATVSSDGKTVPLVEVSAPGLDRKKVSSLSVAEQPLLCLHYDPERLSLARLLSIAKAAGAEISDRYAHTIIPFRLIGSEDDGARLEEGLSRIPGVLATTVSLASQLARVEYDRERVDRGAIEQALRALGAQPVAGKHERGDPQRDKLDTSTPPGKKIEDAHSHERPEPPPGAGWYTRNRELAWSLIAGALLAIGWFLERQDLASWIPIAVFVGAYIFGARDNVSHFIGDLRHGHFRFNIDLLMVVAAIGAAILGEWFEGALLLFLFSLGHAMEHYALGRARNAIKALADIAPQVATVLRDRREQDGRLPPPPHDSTGHTWHHADDMLYRIVAKGTAVAIGDSVHASRYGMPPFESRLSPEEIRAVLAYLKTKWTPAAKVSSGGESRQRLPGCGISGSTRAET